MPRKEEKSKEKTGKNKIAVKSRCALVSKHMRGNTYTCKARSDVYAAPRSSHGAVSRPFRGVASAASSYRKIKGCLGTMCSSISGAIPSSAKPMPNNIRLDPLGKSQHVEFGKGKIVALAAM
jgi:hypothetical protein